MYVWNEYGKACGDVVLSRNQVDWASASGRSSGFWSGGGCASISYATTTGTEPDLGDLGLALELTGLAYILGSLLEEDR